jgi:hypothetical protein
MGRGGGEKKDAKQRSTLVAYKNMERHSTRKKAHSLKAKSGLTAIIGPEFSNPLSSLLSSSLVLRSHQLPQLLSLAPMSV